SGSISSLLALCVSQINEVRNQNGANPCSESPDLESYAAKAAASDASNGQKHSYFYATGGGGVATTEDELDGDQVDPGAGAQQTFEQGLQQDVQAQGQALANLVDQQFTEAGCGFAQDAAGNWWVDMAFR
ncbi:MAG TPA: CAP domain-containing protein, partial [Polyangiaceae bacterium]